MSAKIGWRGGSCFPDAASRMSAFTGRPAYLVRVLEARRERHEPACDGMHDTVAVGVHEDKAAAREVSQAAQASRRLLAIGRLSVQVQDGRVVVFLRKHDPRERRSLGDAPSVLSWLCFSSAKSSLSLSLSDSPRLCLTFLLALSMCGLKYALLGMGSSSDPPASASLDSSAPAKYRFGT